MKTKPKFKIGEFVKSKTNMGDKLEVLRIHDGGSYYKYSCLNNCDAIIEIHQTMLMKWDD